MTNTTTNTVRFINYTMTNGKQGYHMVPDSLLFKQIKQKAQPAYILNAQMNEAIMEEDMSNIKRIIKLQAKELSDPSPIKDPALDSDLLSQLTKKQLIELIESLDFTLGGVAKHKTEEAKPAEESDLEDMA